MQQSIQAQINYNNAVHRIFGIVLSLFLQTTGTLREWNVLEKAGRERQSICINYLLEPSYYILYRPSTYVQKFANVCLENIFNKQLLSNCSLFINMFMPDKRGDTLSKIGIR